MYRRYRPDTFADVIGQEHVTAPLVTALGKDAVSHAYLFSGPRGCGKTTSARILARCLNCAEGPTGTPCGRCDSCHDLATGGPGSLDVIEIDAASHGGVDDARDLRERATFAPVRDRYKIFIIDEAHMVTAAGFNALLKIVEEPPEHIKFIFATTEPDKVIGTIRSRTHHYPFRLVPPEPLLEYLQRLCQQEQVAVAHGVLPLVIRAGGGSVRDTLSVLDQLIAGSTDSGLDYDRSVALLGFTHSALLDDVVDAVAALDGATAFSVVDRVVQSGQDPRRFVEDVLERLRDLIIVKSVPDSPGAILRGVPADQIRRMQDQASQVGAAELSRAADITAQALTDMVGATSPRLHLELLMARLLLPHADQGTSSLAARLERLERRVDFVAGAGVTPTAEAAPEQDTTTPPVSSAPGTAPAEHATPAPQVPATAPEASAPDAPASAPAPAPAPPAQPADEGWATPGVPRSVAEPAHVEAAPAERDAQSEEANSTPAPEEPRRQPPEGAPQQSAPPHEPPHEPQQEAPPQPPQSAGDPRTGGHPEPTSGAPGGTRVEMLQRAWPDIVQALASQSRLLWMLVKDNATVAGFDGKTVTVAFTNDGARSTFSNRHGDQALNAAIQQVLGMQVSFDLITGGAPPGAGQAPKGPSRPTPAPAAESAPEPPQPGTWSSYATAMPSSSDGPADDRPADDRPAGGLTDTTAPDPATPNSPGLPHEPSSPAWLAEEAPEPYEAEPEQPQAPPSPHPAWNGDPSADPAGSALSADSPSEAGEHRDPPQLTDPTYGPTTAPAPSVDPHPGSTPGKVPSNEAPSDEAPTGETPTHRPPTEVYLLSEEKPRVPAFARRTEARPEPSAPQSPAHGRSSSTSPSEAGSAARNGASGRIAAIKQRISQRGTGAEPPGWNDEPPPPDPLYDQGAPRDAAQAGPGPSPAPESEMEDIPSDDDITVEESSVFGRKAIERILDGTLIEERRMGEGPQ
nr:DNA polymerase III subunit gamma and tau [Nesterenkonia xinjiangensis]